VTKGFKVRRELQNISTIRNEIIKVRTAINRILKNTTENLTKLKKNES
jgi:hypothetical protein